jgi:hypothetical protein
MDRYDALLEHLKLTQRHGLDAVANRFNDFVIQLENLVDTMKSSVQEALPTDADELFPIKDLESELAGLNAIPDQAPPPSTGVSLDNLRVLDNAKSQSELLRALLPLLGEHVGRAVVLVIRDGVVTAWSGVGFDNPDVIRSWNGGVAASPHFSQLVETGMPLMIDPRRDPLVSEWLTDQGVPDEGALLPISLRGKLMGIVYVDHEGDQPWVLDAAQAHIATACLLIDTLHNRTEAPSSMLAEVAPLQQPEPAVPAAQEVFETVSEPEPEPAEPEFEQPEVSAFEPATGAPTFNDTVQQTEEIEAAPVAAEASSEEIMEVDYDFEPEPAVEEAAPTGEAFDPSATIQVEAVETPSAADFEPQTQASYPPPSLVPDAAPAQPPAVEETEAPPPVRPIEPPVEPAAGAQPDAAADDPRHEEARRFARLLVSEIKLYNEEEVDRGRIQKDLATRLKEDIERSREMFEKRIAADIRSGHNYFQEELVRILADGNPDALGG